MSYIDKNIILSNSLVNLPSKAQQAINNIDVVSLIWDIGGKYELLIREIGDICEETAKVINGETRPENFIDAIRAKLDDENKNKASDVGIAINTQILTPIREALKQSSTGNLVPNPQEPIKPAVVEQETDEEIVLPEIPTEIPVDYDVTPQTAFNRDSLMREIENPTPAEISTVSFAPRPKFNDQPISPTPAVFKDEKSNEKDKIAEPPQNLPTKTVVDREIPVIRTMQRDVKIETNNQQPVTNNLPQRGKFGHATVPTLKRQVANDSQQTRPNFSSPSQISSEILANKQNLGGQAKQSATTQNVNSFIPKTSGSTGGTIKGTDQQHTTQKESVAGNHTGQSHQNPSSEKVSQPILPVSSTKPILPLPPQKPTSQPVSPSPTPKERVLPTGQVSQTPAPQKLSEQTSPTPVSVSKPTTSTSQTPQKTVFQVPQKTNTVENVVNDKLSKTVNIPAEKKRYIVDPYREPLE